MNDTYWPSLIARLALIKSEIARVDRRKLWPYHLPRAAATRSDVLKAEKSLGFALPKCYSEFLLHANGWPAFYQTVDLFGTDDLIGGERMEYASMLLAELGEKPSHSNPPQDLLPIAATLSDRDLFVLGKPFTNIKDSIIWLAGGEVEKFASFATFFEAMIDYNRRELAMLASSEEPN